MRSRSERAAIAAGGVVLDDAKLDELMTQRRDADVAESTRRGEAALQLGRLLAAVVAAATEPGQGVSLSAAELERGANLRLVITPRDGGALLSVET